jgi:hypothetical protein
VKNFEKTRFAQFMASPAGRITRIVVGLGLMTLGATQGSNKSKNFLLALGAIPLSAGSFDFCLISPLFKGPFWGHQIRSTTQGLKQAN